MRLTIPALICLCICLGMPASGIAAGDLIIQGAVVAQKGEHVEECGLRSDDSLYALVRETSERAVPTGVVVRYRFTDPSGKLLFDQYVPTESPMSAEMLLFGKNRARSLRVACSIAGAENTGHIVSITAGEEVHECATPHAPAVVDYGEDFGLRSLSIGPHWVALRFEGWLNNFMYPQNPPTLKDAPFFTQLDGGTQTDTLLTGRDGIVSVLYPNVQPGDHVLDFGTDDEIGTPPDDFERICFSLPAAYTSK